MRRVISIGMPFILFLAASFVCPGPLRADPGNGLLYIRNRTSSTKRVAYIADISWVAGNSTGDLPMVDVRRDITAWGFWEVPPGATRGPLTGAKGKFAALWIWTSNGMPPEETVDGVILSANNLTYKGDSYSPNDPRKNDPAYVYLLKAPGLSVSHLAPALWADLEAGAKMKFWKIGNVQGRNEVTVTLSAETPQTAVAPAAPSTAGSVVFPQVVTAPQAFTVTNLANGMTLPNLYTVTGTGPASALVDIGVSYVKADFLSQLAQTKSYYSLRGAVAPNGTFSVVVDLGAVPRGQAFDIQVGCGSEPARVFRVARGN